MLSEVNIEEQRTARFRSASGRFPSMANLMAKLFCLCRCGSAFFLCCLLSAVSVAALTISQPDRVPAGVILGGRIAPLLSVSNEASARIQNFWPRSWRLIHEIAAPGIFIT
jgi:hypothetical protein